MGTIDLPPAAARRGLESDLWHRGQPGVRLAALTLRGARLFGLGRVLETLTRGRASPVPGHRGTADDHSTS